MSSHRNRSDVSETAGLQTANASCLIRQCILYMKQNNQLLDTYCRYSSTVTETAEYARVIKSIEAFINCVDRKLAGTVASLV